jgi:multicomponent Na+:H+ antiporter subunit G
MHAATKPQVLGLVLVLLGLAVRLGGVPVVWMLLLVVMFQLLTSPVAAHMVARAGYRTGKVRPDLLEVDELTRDLQAAQRELAERGSAAGAASAELRDAVEDGVDAVDGEDAADDERPEVSGA